VAELTRSASGYFSNQVVVVTGAGSGMGRSMAQQLDAAGAKLALSDVNPTTLAETGAMLRGKPLLRPFDVADRAAFEDFAQETLTHYGHVDVVINNAGVDLSNSLANSSYDDLHWLFNINFWGVVHGTKAFLPSMLSRNAGVIANVSSIFGIVAWPMHGAYVSSKFAVRGFTETLRNELLGSNVRTLVIHPGGIKTNIVKNSRFYVDDTGNADLSRMEREFQKFAMTTADKAASIILRAIEKKKQRVRVGPDAIFMDYLVR
jgi:NADP-dependent 3-hydroxy acid dehydrogenase YdfG